MIKDWIFLKSTLKGQLKMFKLEFLDPMEAKKFNKQTGDSFGGHPVDIDMSQSNGQNATTPRVQAAFKPEHLS